MMRRRRRNRRNRRNRKSWMLTAYFIFFLVLVAVCLGGTLILYKGAAGGSSAPEVTVDMEQLDSPYAILMDKKTGKVLSSKKSDEIIYPASMTKIMTVLTAIGNIKNLNATVTMDAGIYDALYAADASRAGYEPGEEAVIRDLLYGALLPSGAECCVQLALQAAGSESAFVELMNERVRKMGLTSTHFTNCTGLHDDDQYSTVAEIAQILREALDNKTFYTVFTTKSHTSGATDVHPEGLTFESSMFKEMETSAVTGGEILGGKTGYTGEAGHCLASMAEIDGREYILVTAGWASDPQTELYHISDAFLCYNALGSALAELNESVGM